MEFEAEMLSHDHLHCKFPHTNWCYDGLTKLHYSHFQIKPSLYLIYDHIISNLLL